MPTTLIIGGAIFVIFIVCFIIFILMLIKQFKHGGALHGIIGLITGSIWTFIWGWMKHKSLALTKIMILWTVLAIAQGALVGYSFFVVASEIVTLANSIMEEGGLDKVLQGMDQKEVKKISAKKTQKPPKIAKKTKKSSKKSTPQGDRDWGKEAVALWKDGKYAKPNKALDYWNKAIRANPKSPEAYNNRGLAFYNLKRFQKAVKDYSQAIRMNPEDPIAYNNRGNSYYEMMKFEPAESDYNKSIALNPHYANAYLNRGLVYYQMDKNDQACVDFKMACDLKECEGLDWASQEGVCKGSQG
jgi:tetratricopeptide (TPR) repeat protein